MQATSCASWLCGHLVVAPPGYEELYTVALHVVNGDSNSFTLTGFAHKRYVYTSTEHARGLCLAHTSPCMRHQAFDRQFYTHGMAPTHDVLPR